MLTVKGEKTSKKKIKERKKCQIPFLSTSTELTSVDDIRLYANSCLSSINLTYVGIIFVLKGQKSTYCTICNIRIPTFFSTVDPDSKNADI